MLKTKVIKVFSIMTAALLIGTSFAGCGSSQKSNEGASSTNNVATTAATTNETTAKAGDKAAKIVLLQWNGALINDSMTVDVVEEYKKVKPNVTLEIQSVKDSGEFEQTMKIRKSANQLPDIMPLKPYMLSNFAEFLDDMSSVPAANNNLFAKQFAVDGKVIGLPAETFNEFVWYSKSIFKEYNLSVPKTWDEFIQAALKIKQGGKYIPILMGGKDAWPDYPFNEFMPSLIAGDGAYWNLMATQDEPFTKDKPFYQAYEKIKKLYDAKVFGPDPLGVGFDQVKVMFGTKGAMMAAGQWFYGDALKAVSGKTDDVGAFLLPVRDDANKPLNTITMVDLFLSTPKDGANNSEAKDFINWFLTDEKVYKDFTKAANCNSTMGSTKADVAPAISEAFNGVNVNNIFYDGGNADFIKISAAVQFDVKKLGQDMMAGKNLDEMMNNLNKSWKTARAK